MSVSKSLIQLLEHSLDEGQVARRDVLRVVCDTLYSPEWVRLDLAQWLADSGVSHAMGDKAKPLSPCPFSEMELRAADERDEVPLVIPAGLRREHLAKAFGIKHWAINETDVASEAVSYDQWLLVTCGEERLASVGKSCFEAMAAAEEKGQTGLSLKEYILFAYRFRYLVGRFPDTINWTWLPKSSYQSSLVLCGSFPANSDLFINIWPWSEFQSNIGLRLVRRFDASSGQIEGPA